MKVLDANLCISCMHLLDEEGKCTHCHFIQSSYQISPRCLGPGTELAKRYILGKVLGEGSFGITYIGWDNLLQLPVAIKEYYPIDMVSRDAIRGMDKNIYLFEKQGKDEYDENLNKFLNEARCLTRFNQLEGIVSVRDFFYENNTAYIVMEFVEGESLKKYVEKKGLISANKVLTWMKPVMEVMSKVHNSGIIHRDISPDNIIVTPEDKLVLIDFGSARVHHVEMTRSSTVVFKRGYSPEEQYRENGEIGPWSDIYAMCATIYYMLTGMQPPDAVERIITNKIDSLVDMPKITLKDKQKNALMKGMEVHAEQRYQNIKRLMADLYIDEKTDEKNREKRKSFVPVFCILIAVFIVVGIDIWTGRQQKTMTITPSPVTATKEPAVVKLYNMISLVGKTKTEAKQLIEGMGDDNLKVSFVEQYNSKYKKGVVIKQSIDSGTTWDNGTEKKLVITISMGEKKISVPNLVQLNYKIAEKKLSRINLKYKLIWVNNENEAGIVIEQSKKAKAKVSKLSTITLTVSRGPVKKETKDNNIIGVIS